MSSTEPPKQVAEVPPKLSGAASALRYTGIPPSWFQKRPKLPSRNWLIFWGVLGSITSLYIYDRRAANRIKHEYCERVRWRSEEKLNPLDLPRKVRVYACRWPGDEDHNRSMKYFRKYVKPILVAAAVDFELVNGNRHGGLARTIADKIKSQRREALPPDHPLRKNGQTPTIPLPSARSPEQQREREIQGGTVIVGRHTFKEYLHGLRLGWSEALNNIDREELLARQLASDGVLDEPETLDTKELLADEDSPKSRTGANLASSGPKSPLFSHVITQPAKSSTSKPSALLQTPQSDEPFAVPQEVPSQPPLLLLSFKNLIGFRYIPHMIVDFFNERQRAKEGAEAAYTLIEGHVRDFVPPEHEAEPRSSVYSPTELEGLEALADSLPKIESQGGDLDFDIEQEHYIPKGYNKTPKEIADARKKYYEALPGKLVVARSLARGEREPTKEEREHPPPTEVELTTERFKKELKWREELEGWKLLRAGSGIDWDSRLASALRVYRSPPETSA
ncbi:mitochondrial import inner membrane translocase subunit tim54 [Ceratobasidium sp. 423]|nr:mitochondrial import inner membrane translocase subunit tim54 [Ceratobasidium sp. 423]